MRNDATLSIRFYNKKRSNIKTENSGIVVIAQTESYSTRCDLASIAGVKENYGIIKEITELYYYRYMNSAFQCDGLM